MPLTAEEPNITHLYKYKPIDKYLFDCLKNNRLYLPNPTELNDPFDCRPNISLEGDNEDWIRWIDGMYYSAYMKNNLKKNIELLKHNSEELSKVPIDEMKKILVLCLTEVNDNILMWSHYADNHKGICLGFKTTIENDMLGIMFEDSSLKVPIPNVRRGFIRTLRVNYAIDMPPVYDPLKDNISKAFAFVYTKHRNWSYEKERRIAITTSIASSKFLYFKKEVLNEIVFGLYTSPKDKNRIRKIIEQKYLSQSNTVKFYHASQLQAKYAMEIVSE